jgi:hypothetical protein
LHSFISITKKRNQQRSTDYIASLLRQLEQQKENLSSAIQNTYDKLHCKGHQPDLQTLRGLLADSVNSFRSRIYIILDALDECVDDNRKELLKTVHQLLALTDSRVHLFIATRPHITIETLSSHSSEMQTIDVVTGQGLQTQDLKYFIEMKLSEECMDDNEKTFISEGVIDKAQGLYKSHYSVLMLNRFLLAGLHLKSVLEHRNPKNRKKALNSLPQELNTAYTAEMRRIESASSADRKIAKRTLSWIYYAKRTLKMAELQQAIAVDPIENIEDADEDCRDLDPQSLTKSEEIVGCCGSLILWERSTDVVRFSHYTVSEFFKSKGAEHIESKLYISRACLTYLCFDVFKEGACHDP